MCLIDTLKKIPHFKEKPEVRVKSLASGPQSAFQFIHHTDTLNLGSINTALQQSSGHEEMWVLIQQPAKQQTYGVPLLPVTGSGKFKHRVSRNQKIPKAHSTMYLTRTDYLIRAGKK